MMIKAPREQFADNMIRLRTYYGLSLKALSRLTGIDQSVLSRIETTQYGVSIEKLYSIAKALHVEPADMVQGSMRRRWGPCPECKGAGIVPPP